MDLAVGTKVKKEPRDSEGSQKMHEPEPGERNVPSVDFNKLYGDLYRKLINTPVKEIFPQIPSTAAVISPVLSSGSPLISPPASMLHPAFPAFGACTFPTNVLANGIASANGLGLASPVDDKDAVRIRRGSDQKDESTNYLSASTFNQSKTHVQDTIDSIFAEQMKGIADDMDVQKLVEEFRVTLEKFGVSQRFAARFIMQDTSQGNLSFLMEKGKNRRWADLSPRGRIPYLRMKAWLESTEQQKRTLNMLKHSQEMKRASPRESYSRRERFSMFQIHVLCRLFEENPNPPMNTRNAVAERLNIPLDRVNVWFQNQRARGFPARKFLDQNFHEEMHDSLLNYTSQNARRGTRRCSDDSVSNGYTNSYDYDVVNNHRSIPNDVATATTNAQINMLENINGHIPTSSKTEWSNVPFENGIHEPLDFTTTKSGNSGASSVSIGALSDIVNNMNPSYNSPQNEAKTMLQSAETETTGSSNEKRSAEKTASGAAKRKRGMKPQQIIYRPVEDEGNAEAWPTNSKQQNEQSDELSEVPPKRFKSDIRDAQGKVASDKKTENDRVGVESNCSNVTSNAQLKQSKHNDTRDHETMEYIYEIKHSEDDKKEHDGCVESRAVFSAEETVALVQTLYKSQLLEKKTDIRDIKEPDLD